MFITQKKLKEFDPELWASIDNEKSRQEEHIELIASENYTSKSILEIQGSVLTNMPRVTQVKDTMEDVNMSMLLNP